MMLRTAILGVLVSLIGACAFGQPICTAHTPEQAVPSQWRVPGDGQPVPANPRARSSRYRLARVVVDRELHRRWALIANCTHPQFPLQTVPLASGQGATIPILAPDSSLEPVSAPIHGAPVSVERASKQPPMARAGISSVAFRGVATAQNSAVSHAPAFSATASSATSPLVRAGDLVHLWSSDPNVRLEMEVVSLEYGRVGQVIHLRRPGQTTLLAGVVVGKDSAELVP